MAHKAGNPFYGLSDNGRTQMSHVEGLCHVGPAIVHHNGQGRICLFHTAVRILLQLVEEPAQIIRVQIQVDKARTYHLHFGEHGLCPQHIYYLLCNHKRRLVVQLRPCHCAVALVLAQVRAVGHCTFAQRWIVAGNFKGFGYHFCNLINHFFHINCFPFENA